MFQCVGVLIRQILCLCPTVSLEMDVVDFAFVKMSSHGGPVGLFKPMEKCINNIVNSTIVVQMSFQIVTKLQYQSGILLKMFDECVCIYVFMLSL